MNDNGKVVLVTGAGSGIGRAAALAFLGAGHRVVLTGRRQAALDETIALAGTADGAEAPALAGSALAVPTDVSAPDQVASLFARIAAEYGRLDVLFNNAGINVPTTNFGDFTWEQWRSVLAVNLDGCFLCANAAFRMMREQSPRGGRIINNGSISAHVPRPGTVAYAASKHAITGLTKTIALDGRAFDIACGQIDVGNAATPLTRRFTTGTMQADGSMRTEPTMDVTNVGETVLYMASLPPDANALFVTLMATNMPFVGRG